MRFALAIAAIATVALVLLAWPRDNAARPAPSRTDTPPARATEPSPIATGSPVGRTVAPATDANITPPPDRRPEPETPVRRIVGTIASGGRAIDAAEVAIVAGMEQGLQTTTDARGTFVLAPVTPGAQVVRVTVAGRVVAERRVVVLVRDETRFDLDVQPAGDLIGVVRGARRAPVAGARIRCDGQEAWTGADGTFQLRRPANGPARVTITAEGFAPAERTTWTIGAPSIDLLAGCSLTVTLSPLADPGDVDVYVLPAELDGAPAWTMPQPLRMRPGQSVVLNDLPAADVEVRAFHAFASATPIACNLRPGAMASVTLEWHALPILTGQVRDGDRPIAGAVVRLVATRRDEALAMALGRASPWLRLCPAAPLPASRQTATTDAAGNYRFGLPPAHIGAIDVEATCAERTARHRLVDGALELDFDLARR